MYKKLFFIGLVGLFLSACGGSVAVNTNANANVNVNANTNAVAASGNAAPNVNVANTTTNANAAVKPAVDNSPKRIAFGKGQDWGTANVTLAPNATQQIVFSAKSGQMMEVESSSKDVTINLRKGKAQTTEDFGYLEGELQSSGDFTVEIKNSSKKEVKTSVKVTITGGEKTAKKDGKKTEVNEIDESDATVAEDDDVLPPPTETPKKKGN
jgi:hypothetical protein